MDLGTFLALAMFIVFICLILTGYPVAFSFAGTAIGFSFVADILGEFDPKRLVTLSSEWFSTFSGNADGLILIAIPFFVLMGAILEKSGIAERLLRAIGLLMGPMRGGVAIAVVIVGTL